MHAKIKRGGLPSKIPLDMTPMIDVVFQLLTFFIMTLKIVPMEGDFNIRMPLAQPTVSTPSIDQLPPMKVRMQADASGNLAVLALNERVFTGEDRFSQLHNFVASHVGEGSLAESAEIELDCDYRLKYAHVIEAITAVSGSVGPDGHIVKLVEKIKFAPPRE